MGSMNEVNQILNEFGSQVDFDICDNHSFQKAKINRLIEVYEKSKDSLRVEEQIDLCSQIGRYYACQGEEQQAFDYFLQGMHLATEQEDVLRQAVLYSYISTTYLRINSYHEALKNYHLERNCYNSLSRETDLVVERILLLNINLGLCYSYLDRYDMADMYLKIIDGKRFLKIREKYIIWINMLRSKVSMGMGELEQAFYYANLVIMDSKSKRNRDYFWVYQDIFYLLLEHGRKDDAKKIMIALIEIAEDAGLDCYEIASADAVVSYCKLFGDRSSYLSAMREFVSKSMRQDHVLKEQKQLGNLLRNEISNIQFENKRLQRKIDHYKAKIDLDEVTQLPNRESMLDYAENKFEEAKKNHSGFGLNLIDLNHLKHVTDTYGHMKSDKCMSILANMLRHTCEGNYIARSRGNQFIVLFTSVNKEQMDETVSKIQENLDSGAMEQGDKISFDDLSIHQSLVWVIPKEELSLSEVFKVAEDNAKRGRGV